jgi:hypothetical protein
MKQGGEEEDTLKAMIRNKFKVDASGTPRPTGLEKRRRIERSRMDRRQRGVDPNERKANLLKEL